MMFILAFMYKNLILLKIFCVENLPLNIQVLIKISLKLGDVISSHLAPKDCFSFPAALEFFY